MIDFYNPNTLVRKWVSAFRAGGYRFNMPSVLDVERQIVETELGAERSDALTFDAHSRTLRTNGRFILTHHLTQDPRYDWDRARAVAASIETTRERLFYWLDDMRYATEGDPEWDHIWEPPAGYDSRQPADFDHEGLAREIRVLIERYVPPPADVPPPAGVIGESDAYKLVPLWPEDDPMLTPVDIPKRLTRHVHHYMVRRVDDVTGRGPSTDLSRRICNLIVEPGSAQARYPGTETYPYYVEVSWAGKRFTGRRFKGRCSCPVHRGKPKWCKHSSGLAYVLADQVERGLLVS